MEFSILELRLLKEHEEVDSKHVDELEIEIRKNGYVIPIVIDANSMVILDGHHRYNVLKRFNARYVPVIAVDYDDDSIILGYWREEYSNISKEDVIRAGNNGKKFPCKTSRHTFPFKNVYEVDLKKLL